MTAEKLRTEILELAFAPYMTPRNLEKNIDILINQFKENVCRDWIYWYSAKLGVANSCGVDELVDEYLNAPEPVDEVKGGFCPYCKTYNAYSVGDHTECNNCENVWAS